MGGWGGGYRPWAGYRPWGGYYGGYRPWGGYYYRPRWGYGGYPYGGLGAGLLAGATIAAATAPYYGYGYGYAPAYYAPGPYAAVGECVSVRRRVWTPYGYRVRWVNPCY
jgi:hypothetical protein